MIAFANWSNIKQKKGDIAISEIIAEIKHRKIQLLVFAIVSIALAVAFTIPMSLGITRPIKYSADIAERVAGGDLQQEIVVNGSNEVASLMRSLRKMQSQLSRLALEVRDTSYSVAVESDNLNSKNDDLFKRTELQHEALARAVESIEQLILINQKNNESAVNTRKLSDAANTSAVNGGMVVEQVIGAMDDIQNVAKQINEITGVINGIAFQTNILALNAAVEAAHAGPQGKGFSVVATEVRLLAQKASASAKEIQELIDVSQERIAQGSALVKRAGKSMIEIVTSSKKVNELTVDICKSAQEQGHVIDTTNDSIAAISMITARNSNLVVEMAKMSSELKSQSSVLIELVDFFKINDIQAREKFPKNSTFDLIAKV